MPKFIITSTPILDGMKIVSYLGVVNTNIVIGTNFFSDFAASFTDVFGGNSGTYQRKMDAMYTSAKKELVTKVKNMGGNAIVGFNVEFDEISGKGKSMFMLTATGTACFVVNQQDSNNENANVSNVDAYELEKEIKKLKILDGLSKSFYSPTEKEWNYLLENPSSDIVKLLVDKMYFQYSETGKRKTEALVSRLDFDEAVSMVYPNFIEPKEETYTFEYGTQKTSEVSNDYIEIIKNCKLFEPSYVIQLVAKNINKTISLLECEKNVYTMNDLKEMEKICELLGNLPDTGRKEKGKSGIFSKEKEIWICSKGHKNELEEKFCQTCGKNIKGLTVYDIQKIENFKTKTKALATILNRSTI